MIREQKPRNAGIIKRSLLTFQVLADQTILNREIEFVINPRPVLAAECMNPPLPQINNRVGGRF